MKKNMFFLILLLNQLSYGQNNRVIFDPLFPQDTTTSYVHHFSKYDYDGLKYKYLESSIKHRIKTLNTQYTISIIIFIVVIVLVFFGLFFSWKHFKYHFKENKNEEKTKLKVNFNGIEISSNIIGVIILTFSLVFFYLYLVHIFPIKIIE